MLKTIRGRLTLMLIALGVGPLIFIGLLIAGQTISTQREQALKLEQEVVRRLATQVENLIGAYENDLRLLVEVGGLSTLPPEEQRNLLAEIQAFHDGFAEIALLDSSGQEQVRLSRIEIVSDAELASRSGEAEFEGPLATAETYFSPVHFDERTGEPLLTIAVPIQDLRSGVVDGVLVADIRFQQVWAFTSAEERGSGEDVYIVDSEQRLIAHHNPSLVLGNSQFAVPAEDGVHEGLTGRRVVLASTILRFGEQHFIVVAERDYAVALRLATTNITVAAVALVVTAVTAVGIASLAVRPIVQPLQNLVETAEKVQGGDLSQQVELSGTAELRELGRTFNEMTARLRQTVSGLEEEVAERARALEMSIQVSNRLSTILNEKQLVVEVVEQVQRAFNYYHVHIYLFDEAEQNLVMAGGTGEAGQVMLAAGHKLGRGRGLVGRAAETQRVVLVSDVSQEPAWLPNPLLPETRSEMAVPIAIGGYVLGVLDIQHNVTGGLQEKDTELVQSLANQVAVALQNARLYTQAQQHAERETLLNSISQRIQRATSIESALQVAAEELGRTMGATRTTVQLASPTRLGNGRGQESS